MVWALPVLLLVNTGQTQDIYLRGPRPDYNDDAPRTAAANVYAPEVSVPIPESCPYLRFQFLSGKNF